MSNPNAPAGSAVPPPPPVHPPPPPKGRGLGWFFAVSGSIVLLLTVGCIVAATGGDLTGEMSGVDGAGCCCVTGVAPRLKRGIGLKLPPPPRCRSVRS